MTFPTSVHCTLTPEDLANGTASDPWSCPVALAITRALAPYKLKGLNVSVTRREVGISMHSWLIYAADTPETIQTIVDLVDSGHKDLAQPAMFLLRFEEV